MLETHLEKTVTVSLRPDESGKKLNSAELRGLPKSKDLPPLMGRADGRSVDVLVEKVLIEPLSEFMQRPSKKFRGRLVHLGFQLAGESAPKKPTPQESQWCELGAELLESVHAASLVIDDIQDMSLFRRGQPTLHRKHGVPIALNAGNWLYFWPLEKVAQWGLSPIHELRVYRVIHQALLRAHFGQGIDVGIAIDSLPQHEIREVCRTSLELKTGALMELAMALGAILGGASPVREAALGQFARAFGVALQMFDDLGNLKSHGIDDPKQYEDLLLRRPSWVWASAAEHLDASAYQEFCEVVRQLPKTEAWHSWVKTNPLRETARMEAKRFLNQALDELNRSLPDGRFFNETKELSDLADRLSRAYE